MNKKRTRQLSVRLTENELQEVKRKVIRSGLRQQDYIRLILLDGIVTNTDGVKAVIPEMKRIGNNINQIARKCNEGGSVWSEDMEHIRKEMKRLWQLLRLYLPMRE